mgnify:CR=1 FL=1
MTFFLKPRLRAAAAAAALVSFALARAWAPPRFERAAREMLHKGHTQQHTRAPGAEPARRPRRAHCFYTWPAAAMARHSDAAGFSGCTGARLHSGSAGGLLMAACEPCLRDGAVVLASDGRLGRAVRV